MSKQNDSFLDFLSLDKKVKKVKVRGAQTGGRVKIAQVDEPPSETHDAHLNDSYYTRHRETEEQRMKESSMTSHQVTERADHTDLTRQFDFTKSPRARASLPISAYNNQILDCVHKNQVVVVSGFTGCGKTTQVPQFILDKHAKDNKWVNIVVTQPRRLAARSVAERVCQERGWDLGSLVGYQVGLDKANQSNDTRLLYVTTGLLKRIIINKKNLNEWSHIILDEVHERGEDMDFVMMLCRRLITSNSPNVKIILMSATMDEEKFCQYFNNAPKIVLPNMKTNNLVEEHTLENFKSYFPAGCEMPKFKMGDAKLHPFCIDVCRTLIEKLDITESQRRVNSYIGSESPPEAGAVLVFLPGIVEIQTVHERLKEKNCHRKGTVNEPGWWILPLHSSIPVEEHRLIFKKAPVGQRKIILSTNIAESSITVPDIVYVVDFCLTKNIQTDEETNYPRLMLEWASKQQCRQRMGRAGRVQEGILYRLVSSPFYQKLNQEHEPDLKRAPLSKVILDTKLLEEFGSPRELLAIVMDPPNPVNLVETICELKEMGTLLTTVKGLPSTEDGDLTVLGEIIANLPVDVRIGKLIVYGHIFNVLDDAIIIAAGLNGKSVFTAPFERKIQAYKNKLWWADRTFSDCFATLLAFKTWVQKHRRGEFKAGNRNARKQEQLFCDNSFLQLKVLQEMKLQFDDIERNLKNMNIRPLQKREGEVIGEEERFLVLRLIIFGAFYPNYFRCQESSEMETQAHRILGGRDPRTCIYLSGFPTEQMTFGSLYENQLKSIFSEATYQTETDNLTIEVEPNREGNKVVVEFKRPENEGDMTFSKKASSNEIIPPVYVAAKMKTTHSKTVVNLYTPEEAQRRHLELKKAVQECSEKELNTFYVDQIKPPDMNVTCLKFSIQHITDPNKFWIHMEGQGVEDKEERLMIMIARWRDKLSHPEPATLSDLVLSSSVVLAPYEDLHFRARVLQVDPKGFARVFFIDYGNVETVRVEHLKVIDKRMVKQDPDILRIPGLALECSLSHVQPNKLLSGTGCWSEEAISVFKDLLNKSNPIKYGEIFSVTKSSSGRTNFLVSLNSLELVLRGQKIEMKTYLLQNSPKFAEKATESAQSEEDAKNRAMFSTYDETMQRYLNDYRDRYKIEKPKIKMKTCEDRRLQTEKCELRGPYSPLEYEVTSVHREGSNLMTHIDMDSVNSVLLNQNPSDPHEQWMVAAHVGMSSNKEVLLLRNTTLMPAVPGLGSIATMIFAPQVELRTNSKRNQLIGFIAGLGPRIKSNNVEESTDKAHNEPTWGYFSKHDMEVKLDVEMGMDDITRINKLRYCLNKTLSKSEDGEYLLSKPRILDDAHNKIMAHLRSLLNKSRKFVEKQPLPSGQDYRWNVLESEHRMRSQLTLQGKFFLKMIDGVNLQKTREEEMIAIREILLEQQNHEGPSLEPFPVPFRCPCCVRPDGNRVEMWSPREILLHNDSREHVEAEEPYLY